MCQNISCHAHESNVQPGIDSRAVLCCRADRDEHEHVHATEALWTLAIDINTWQQRHPSGPLPAPSSAIGLAVFNGHANMLANVEKMAGCMKVYELDLEAWH